MDGDVLLMDGSVPAVNQREGRVEICYENVYHTICDDLWDTNAAQVVCRQLNISGDSKIILVVLVCMHIKISGGD